MNTQPRPIRMDRIAQAVAIILVAAVLIGYVAVVLAVKAADDRNDAAPHPLPTVTYVVPAPPSPQPTDCADAAQWYYEHYLALLAESGELANGTREASPEWLAERIGPAMADEPEAFADLQACREAVR